MKREWITELKDLDKYEENIYEYIGNASDKIDFDAIKDLERFGDWLYDLSSELYDYCDAITDLDLYKSSDCYEDTISYVRSIDLNIYNNIKEFNDALNKLKVTVEYIEENLEKVEEEYANVEVAVKNKLEEFELEDKDEH